MDGVTQIRGPSDQRNPVTAAASGRGERLNPPPTNRAYWHLVGLRTAFETVISRYVVEPSCQRLIDFGCGNMPYRPLFEPFVEEYIGCDLPGNELAERIMKAPNCLPIAANEADAVLSSQVLEHVSEPAEYLTEAYRVLRDNGLLILSTHGLWRYHPDPFDFWRWTCSGLRKQIESVGFTICEFTGLMGPEATALQLYQDAVLPRIPRWWRKAFTWRMQQRIRHADRRCSDNARNRDACVYMVVARKEA